MQRFSFSTCTGGVGGGSVFGRGNSRNVSRVTSAILIDTSISFPANWQILNGSSLR